jgi:hypothetical protein
LCAAGLGAGSADFDLLTLPPSSTSNQPLVHKTDAAGGYANSVLP